MRSHLRFQEATLPENYKHFASAWDSTPAAEKTLSNLTARLLGEENLTQEIEEPVLRTNKKRQNNNEYLKEIEK